MDTLAHLPFLYLVIAILAAIVIGRIGTVLRGTN